MIFKTQQPKKSRLPIKWKKNPTENFNIQKYYKKIELKNIQNDSWFHNFWLREYFCFEINKIKNFQNLFQKAE